VLSALVLANYFTLGIDKKENCFRYLAGNFFTGPVPEWTMDNKRSL